MPVICFGELIVDMMSAEPGKTLKNAERFHKYVGGAPANVAVGLHYHGIPVKLWSRVGRDSFGDFLIDRLKKMGLDTAGISQDRVHPTKLALVGIDEQGERHFEFHNRRSAEQFISIENFDLDLLNNSRIFHFGAVSLLGDVTAATTFQLLEEARKTEILISFDPNIRLDLCPRPEELLQRIHRALRFVHLLKLSETERQMLFPGMRDEKLRELGPDLIVVTRGAGGCKMISFSSLLNVSAETVSAANTTGAGDAFMAALLAAIYRGGWKKLSNISSTQLRKAAELANHWAGVIIQHQGALTAYTKNPQELHSTEKKDEQQNKNQN